MADGPGRLVGRRLLGNRFVVRGCPRTPGLCFVTTAGLVVQPHPATPLRRSCRRARRRGRAGVARGPRDSSSSASGELLEFLQRATQEQLADADVGVTRRKRCGGGSPGSREIPGSAASSSFSCPPSSSRLLRAVSVYRVFGTKRLGVTGDRAIRCRAGTSSGLPVQLHHQRQRRQGGQSVSSFASPSRAERSSAIWANMRSASELAATIQRLLAG